MSLHDAVEIKQREADLKKGLCPRVAASGLFGVSLLFSLGVVANALGNRPQSRDAYALIMISAGGLYLAYHHHKNRRRIEIVELELLKLKRGLPESLE